MSKSVKQKNSQANPIRTVIIIAVLTALSVVVSYFLTFRVGNVMKLSPVFIITALAGYKFGIWGAVTISVFADMIQYMLFPSNGFSVGIFLSNVVLGLIFGLCFYKKFSFVKILIAATSSQILCTILIPTYFWVYVEKWYPTIDVIIYPRILQGVIMFVVMIVSLYLLFIKTDLIKKIKL